MPDSSVTHAKILDWIVPGLLTLVVMLLANMANDMSAIKERLAISISVNGVQDLEIKDVKARLRDIEVMIYRAPLAAERVTLPPPVP